MGVVKAARRRWCWGRAKPPGDLAGRVGAGETAEIAPDVPSGTLQGSRRLAQDFGCALAKIGGKGSSSRNRRGALQETIDLAVHSMRSADGVA